MAFVLLIIINELDCVEGIDFLDLQYTVRECTEKIQLLNSDEERQRRLHGVLEIHTDPSMDPTFKSENESAATDQMKEGSIFYPGSLFYQRVKCHLATFLCLGLFSGSPLCPQVFPLYLVELVTCQEKLVQKTVDTLLENGISCHPVRDGHKKVYKSFSAVTVLAPLPFLPFSVLSH